jgi:hypothetical protein
MLDEFQTLYQGNLTSTLRWQQLDELWQLVLQQPDSWYIYCVGENLPHAKASSQDLQQFVLAIDKLLRQDHDYDYCGIVYADNLKQPNLIKIYDPNNLGASCGFSGKKVHPGWILSQLPPSLIQDPVPLPMNRKRWWTNLFKT